MWISSVSKHFVLVYLSEFGFTDNAISCHVMYTIFILTSIVFKELFNIHFKIPFLKFLMLNFAILLIFKIV